ncbi:MAG: hypothetical protein HGA85_02780 [Nanoarchaeota archaeon]|nr:hypothetical protein [Nanoarchaeota archaeon]
MTSQTKLLYVVIAFLLVATASAQENISNTSVAYLKGWDNSPIYVNETAEFFANYSSDSGPILLGDCILLFETHDAAMAYDSGIYAHSEIFDESGNFTYILDCNSTDYAQASKASIFEVLPIFINESVNTSQNNSQNISTDFDVDGFVPPADCNDNDPNINPGKQEVYYNSKDDDCNPLTQDTVQFTVNVERQSYSSGEVAKIMISAPNNSDTYLTINTPTNISYVYIFSNGTYPATQEYSMTGLAGTYTIDAINYLDIFTTQAHAEFNVQTSMNVDLQADKDHVSEGEKIHFRAVVTGAQGNANMLWKMDNGQELSVPEFDYNYSYARDYNIVLLVTDYGGNQVVKTKKIVVEKRFDFKVRVLDNTTGEIIPNATVRLDSDTEKVNSSGYAVFSATNRTYDLKVQADSYYKLSQDIKLNATFEYTVRLSRNLEYVSPVLQILEPANGTAAESVRFRYRFSDNGNADCSLFMNSGTGWWEETNSTENAAPGADILYSLKPEEGEYTWKITCEDSDGNVAESGIYGLTITKPADTQADTTYNVIQDVYNVIPDFDTYSPDEKRVVAYLDLATVIKDAKRKLEMANRDLYNLRLQSSTESVMDEQQSILDRIEEIKDTTPYSIAIVDKKSFTSYSSDEDIESILRGELSSLSEREQKRIISANKALQKSLSVSTTAYQVEIKYIGGRTDSLLIVSRLLDYTGDRTGKKYIEYFGDGSGGSSDVVFLKSPEEKNEDWVQFDFSGMDELVYYSNSDITLDNVPKIKPMIFDASAQVSQQITGLAIFDVTNNKTGIFILEMIVIAALLGVYLYNRKALPSVSEEQPVEHVAAAKKEISLPIGSSGDTGKLQYIQSLLYKAGKELKEGNLKQAAINTESIILEPAKKNRI